MDPEVSRLAGLLDEMVELLAAHSRMLWSDWLARDAALLREGDGAGITHFLSAFGGMGSLNDVRLEPRPDDDRFYALKRDAWALATELQREAEIED